MAHEEGRPRTSKLGVLVGIFSLVLSHPLWAKDLPDAPPVSGYSSEYWSLSEGLVAGIRSTSSNRSGMTIGRACDHDSTDLRFTLVLGVDTVYYLYIANSLIPALNQGKGALTLTIDGGERIRLNEVSALMSSQAQAVISGKVSADVMQNTFSTGSSISAQVYSGSSIMLAQSFTLKGSADVIAGSPCATASVAVSGALNRPAS